MSKEFKFDLLPSFVNSEMKKNIIYVGSNNTSGYTNAAFGYIYHLIENGNNVNFIPYLDDKESESYPEIQSCINNKISSPDVAIIHSIPELWDPLIKKHKISANKIIGRTVWEFETLPKKWVDIINHSQVNIISVPSVWNKNTFVKCGVVKTIIVEPHVLINKKYNLVKFSDLLKSSIIYGNQTINENAFKIYSISQLITRKGVGDALNAYCTAFNNDKNVTFLISSFIKNHDKNDHNKIDEYVTSILKKYKNHPQVIYLKNKLTYDEIKSLHYYGDCYFSMTKSEGVGLPLLDAAENNKPILITGYGGHLEYIKKNIEYVPYELKPVNSEIYKGCYLNDEYFWASPSIEYAAEKLKYIVKNKLFIDNIVSINSEEHSSILYIGQYGTSGYATAAKQYIANYVLNSVPVSWCPLYFDSSELDDNNYVNILAKSTINKKINYNTVILHCTPDLWPGFLESRKYDSKKKIGYTVWETNVLNPEWVKAINLMDEVWCPSTYNKKVFKESGVSIPIKVIPHLFFKSTLPSKKDVNIADADTGQRA
jgi:glycosyltransferase involved in cell wall biosynthesis